MPDALNLKAFLLEEGPILDVRSPAEYEQGHIPTSHSFPLFSNEERAQIGTTYKKEDRQEAISLGLAVVNSKLESLLEKAAHLLVSKGKILCWRGGMRSGSVARLLELMGYSTYTLQGGYKTYRRWAIQYFNAHAHSFPLVVLGGLTGSGKTAILHALQQIGEQVIDLEAIAKHCGSAFGNKDLSQQPTQEQFENELAFAIARLDPSRPIWIEDESRLIGRCHLPTALYQCLLKAPVFYVQRSLSERLQYLLSQYGAVPKQQLIDATQRIEKRLGSQLTKEVRLFIEEGKNEQACEQLLHYYDKTYQYQIAKRQTIYPLQESFSSPLEWAFALQTFYKQKNL